MQILPHTPTLSFGENDQTCYGTELYKKCIQVRGRLLQVLPLRLPPSDRVLQIVSDISANPNYEGPLHRFLKLDHNHRNVCKPSDPADPRYREVVDFIEMALKSYAERQHAKRK